MLRTFSLAAAGTVPWTAMSDRWDDSADPAGGPPPDGQADASGAPSYGPRNAPDQSAAGMGTNPSGPSFQSPHSGGSQPTSPLGMPAPAHNSADRYRPPRSRLPAIITGAAVLIVALVVGLSTIVANINDRQAVTPTPSPTRERPSSAPSGDSIDFTSDEGAGTLRIINHEWTVDGQEPPISGNYLRIEVDLTATAGEVSYDSTYFQAFDAQGELFDSTPLGAVEPHLDAGLLGPGDSARGFIAFDMPRGDVTLLMSNESFESVTAIKIQD